MEPLSIFAKNAPPWTFERNLNTPLLCSYWEAWFSFSFVKWLCFYWILVDYDVARIKRASEANGQVIFTKCNRTFGYILKPRRVTHIRNLPLLLRNSESVTHGKYNPTEILFTLPPYVHWKCQSFWLWSTNYIGGP